VDKGWLFLFVENRESPNQFQIGPGFFYVRQPINPDQNQGGIMAGHEQAHTKLTLFLIKDWDSFQIAMRGCLQ